MREHELRRQVVSEMHLRRWPLLQLPVAVFQWVLEVGPGEREAERSVLSALCGSQSDEENPRHLSGALFGDVSFTWERQSEGSTLTVFCPERAIEVLLDPGLDSSVGEAIDWAETLPGAIIRATSIWVGGDEAEVERALPAVDFNRSELVSCGLSGGVRIWSDFRIHPDGRGRLVVSAGEVDRSDLTRQLQQLQELGNYRNKALLGLPVAQEAWPRLDAAERELAALAKAVTSSVAFDDDLLAQLSDLSLELSTIATSIGYRMNATAAYSRLVEERLAQLAPEPIRGFASLVDFTERRFLPAARTCAALTERERQLTRRARQISELLRARIETRIENQNAKLLRSMERSTTMQVRLQQIVEGLSVVAVSYYAIGLLGYAIKGASHHFDWVDPEVAIALLVLPVLGSVWFALHSLKKRVLGGH